MKNQNDIYKCRDKIQGDWFSNVHAENWWRSMENNLFSNKDASWGSDFDNDGSERSILDSVNWDWDDS